MALLRLPVCPFTHLVTLWGVSLAWSLLGEQGWCGRDAQWCLMLCPMGPVPPDVNDLLKFIRPLHEGTLVFVASYDDPATK